MSAAASGAYKASHDPHPTEAFAGATAQELSANQALKLSWQKAHALPAGLVSHGSSVQDLQQRAVGNPRNAAPADVILNAMAIPAHASPYVTAGYAWAYINNTNEQGQDNFYFCGPATVSESAFTQAANGRLSGPVSQSAAAGPMGTNSDVGTTAAGLTKGMNQFVGNPVMAWDFYVRVDTAYTPTDQDRTNWDNNLVSDISNSGMTLASVAWEAYNGPHLVGHPNLTSDIFHIVETYGYDFTGTHQLWYADSATTVWSSVPPYSKFDDYTFVSIMGGRGYDW